MKKEESILMCISYIKIVVNISVETVSSFMTNYAADHNVNGTKSGVTGSPFETCVTDR
jgi:hypothetical protein